MTLECFILYADKLLNSLKVNNVLKQLYPGLKISILHVELSLNQRV